MAQLRLGKILRDVRNHDLIITPSLNEWLIVHGDDELKPHIAKLITDQLTTRPRVRSGSFSASSAGRCYREQELGFLGMPKGGAIDPQLAMIFMDGKWRHLRWQATLLQAELLNRMEFPVFWKSKRSRGTLDGSGIVSDDHPRVAVRGLEFGFELKGVNPFAYHKAVKQEGGVKEEHENQVNRYFLMTGFDLFVTIYENKATQEWFEWVSFPDPERMAEQRKELDKLNKAIDKQKLHPMLHQCEMQTGVFNECDFGGKHGSCIKAGKWPNIKKGKR